MGGEMMKRAAIAAGAMLLAAVLGGCAGPTGVTAPRPSESTSPAPLVAESSQASADDREHAFLEFVRASLPSDTVIPDATDEQLLAAGAEACQRYGDGEDPLGISVIEGEEPNGLGSYDSSSMIVAGAVQHLCG